MTIVQWTRMVVVVVLVWAIAGTIAANDYTIKLKTTEFEPPQVKGLSLQKSAAVVDRHILIQFEQPVDQFMQSSLERDGIKLLQYVPNLAYTAKVTKSFDQDILNRYGIRWYDEIQTFHKISPLLADVGKLTWAHRDNNRFQFVVALHKDVDAQTQANRFVRSFGAEIISIDPIVNSVEMIVSDQAFYRLADLDQVLWVQPCLPHATPALNGVRAATGVDDVHAAPYNLNGAGVSAAMWDYASPDLSHPDLGNVTIVVGGDSGAVSNHTTIIAGVIGGTGTANPLYTGIAPATDIYTYVAWLNTGAAQTQHGDAYTLFGARISNNALEYINLNLPVNETDCDAGLGAYTIESASVDEIARGSAGYPFLISWAAGNQRAPYGFTCGTIGYAYNTITQFGTSKNVTTVGATFNYTGGIAEFTGWGPTDDGRIKPDVVAPGGAVYAPSLGGGYTKGSGTSIAAAVVSGIYALMLEQSDLLYPGETFLASTYRGILVNTADDRESVGPNYESGWGDVNALEAVRTLMDRDSSWIEESISTSEVDEYDLTITTGADLEVSLVWDDPGPAVITSQALVNDLELVLVDPDNNEYDAWVLLPSNPAVHANRGKDHVNNIEVVSVADPVPGLWKARVTGTNVPDGPQEYSLIFGPRKIHTPGNTIALAVYEPPFTEVDPGNSFQADFEVINAGLAADSAHVTITDDAGWLVSSVDTTIYLAVGQSAIVSASVAVPPGAFGWEETHLECVVVSDLNATVVSRTTGIIGANSVYSVALITSLNNLVANSPDTLELSATFQNNGNDYDDFVLTLNSSSDWTFNYPTQLANNIAPAATELFNFKVYIPREELHDDVITVNVTLSTDGGASAPESFDVTINNPYPPPTLNTPVANTFTQNRVFTFNWEDQGADSYDLQIGTDANAGSPVRSYTGITTNSFSMPVADSLPDYTYWWAVRRHVGAEQSSFQRYPYRLVVDNEPPPLAYQVEPYQDQYVGPPNFVCVLGGIGGGESPGESPQFVTIEFCEEPTFSSGVISKITASDIDYEMDEVLPLGRWYWRVQHADSAGNSAPWSGTKSFVMDWETPPIPTVVYPVDRSYLAPSSINFQWTIGPPPSYEHAPVYYRFQIASDSQYINNIYDQYLSDTSIAVISGGLFTADSTYFWRVAAFDSAGHGSRYQPDSTRFLFSNEPPPVGDCGDINGNNSVNISDLTFLVSYLFGVPPGPAPEPLIRGSVNCDDKVNISDITYMVAYLFGVPTGPEPCCL